MSEDLVTVIIPTFNSATYVERAIRSVLGQTHHHLQILIIDDASTDDTVDVCKAVAANDGRLQLVTREENGGGAASRNDGIDAARGKWVAFLDADDEWFPQKIETQLRFMRQQSADVTYTGYERQNESGRLLSQVHVPHGEAISYTRLLKRNIVGCSTAMVRRSFLGETRFPPLRKRQDYGLWLSLARKGARIVGLDECLARYHLRSDSVSANRIDLVRFNWQLYRECEGLGILHSAWLIVRNTLWVFRRSLFGA
jgi:teichuronic acid biosynthesis glycosyltransferase TuaG